MIFQKIHEMVHKNIIFHALSLNLDKQEFFQKLILTNLVHSSYQYYPLDLQNISAILWKDSNKQRRQNLNPNLDKNALIVPHKRLFEINI